MTRTRPLFLIAIVLIASAIIFTLFGPRIVKGASGDGVLTGMVKSATGEKMAGVTVSTRIVGSSITTSVFTDEQGNYYFPPLSAGKYEVWAQADTFQTARGSVELSSIQHQDFTLQPLKDFARQLTGDQLIDSFPDKTADDKRMKLVFRNTCTSCHQPNYILQNRFDADGWVSMMNLMRQIGVTGLYGGEDSAEAGIIEYHKKELAAYLARVSGPSPTEMKFKIRPRPTGDAARVVFTEYQVPLDPAAGYQTKYVTNDGTDWSLGTPSSLNGGHGVHDAQADLMGNIWFTYNVESTDITVGRVDAVTGEVKFFKVPGGHPGMAAASHGMTRDPKGYLWFNVNPGGRGSLGRIDPEAQKIDVFTPPPNMSGVTGGATTIDVDGKGKVWVTAGTGALRFDPDTQQFMAEYKSIHYTTADGNGNTYGLAADREGNAWWEEMSIDTVGKSDIETGKSQEVVIPPVPGRTELATPEESKMYHMAGAEFNFAPIWSEGPRRMGADHNGDYVWVCDYWGGNLAKIDIHTLKTTIIPLPNPDVQQPYAAAVDSRHNVWVNLMNSDEVARFNPSTSKWTEFPIPTLGGETRYISILEKDGTTQIILPYSRARKVARMVLRSKEDIQALQNQVNRSEQASAR